MTATQPRLRILIADDNSRLTAAIGQCLATEFEIVGVHDIRAVVQSTMDLRPDIVLIDALPAARDGFSAASEIRRLLPGVAIVFHTLCTEDLLAERACALGAATFVADGRKLEQLSTAIRLALGGDHPAATTHDRLASSAAPETPLAPDLTDRECEVLALLAGGCRMKEIAYRLGITYRTVTFHKYRAMKKLNVQRDTDVVRLALRGCVPELGAGAQPAR